MTRTMARAEYFAQLQALADEASAGDAVRDEVERQYERALEQGRLPVISPVGWTRQEEIDFAMHLAVRRKAMDAARLFEG